MSRRITAVLGMVILLSLFTGTLVSAATNTTISIVLSDFADANTRKIMQEVLVPEFEKNHPGVKVDVSWIPWTGYEGVLLTRYAGGALPDIISIGAAALGQFIKAGMVMPIDQYMRNWSGLRDMVPPAIEDGKVGDRFFSVAYMLDQRTFVYNKTVFEESGLDSAKPPRTWDEMLRAAKLTVRVDGAGKMVRKGYDLRTAYHHMMPFVFQADGGYLSADGKKALMNSPNTVEAIEFMHSLVHEHRVSEVTSGGNILTPTAAMLTDSTWFMGRDPEGNIGVATPLKYRKQTAQVHINKFAITTQSKNPDLAWELIAFIMEPRNLALLATNSGVMVPRISAYRLEPYKNDPRWNTWLESAMMATGLPGGAVPEAPTIASMFSKAVVDVLQNKAPAKSRMDQLVQELEAGGFLNK